MKKLICSFLFLLLIASVTEANVDISETNFPDYTFRNLIDDFDTNKNNILEDDEIKKVTSFDWQGVKIDGKPMYSIKGIEYFTELTKLYVQNNQLSSIDVSKNTKLEYLDCSVNTIDTLNLSANTQLKELNCWANNLKLLDVSNHKNLVSLDCNMNYLDSLNVNGCSSLNFLHSPNNLLTSLNIEECSNLKVINLNGNRLSQLDFRGFTKLSSLDCSTNMLVSLDVNGCAEISGLDCQDNRLKYINLNGCTKLENINCSNNQLDNINVNSLTYLTKLICENNRLSGIDVSRNYLLASLKCGNNNITAISLENNRNLFELELSYNHIAELNLNGKIKASAHVSMDQQTLTKLNVISQAGNEYPFKLDFNEYVSAVNINNIIASSVQGFDESNEKIDTLYSDGTAQFKLLPAKVQYLYNTGLNGVNMDIAIGTSDFLSLALNNHVYRIFNNFTNWENARTYCKELGGDLAVITTDDEKKLVQELIKKARFSGENSSGGYWIGAGLNKTDNSWKWINDEVFEVTVSPVYTISRVIDIKGESGTVVRQVTREYPEGVYLQVTEDGKFIGWHDLHPSGFICEFKPIEVETAPLNPDYVLWSNDREAYNQGQKNYGVIPSPVDLSHLVANPPAPTWTTALSSVYDPRTAGRKLPPVKNQSPYGTCWSFGSIGALEASYITQFGSPAPNLSELHQVWFAYKDPRKQNRIFNRDDSLKTVDKVLRGGHSWASIRFLSRAGTAYEKDLPYSSATNVQTLTANKYPESYTHPIRLRDAYQLGDGLNTNTVLRDHVKQFVLKNGAVAIAFYIDNDYLSNKNAYFSSSSEQNTNHIVQIVGWDDDYLLENFNSNNRPKSNGAWLIKNSHGGQWGDNGYAWLSYEEYIDDVAVYVADRKTGGTIYGHDNLDYTVPYLGGGSQLVEQSIARPWAACVFQAVNDEPIQEVAFHTLNNKISYEIYVTLYGAKAPYKPSLVNADKTTGIANYKGYHTITLAHPLAVKRGDYFSVVVHLTETEKSTYPYLSAAENTGKSASEITVAGKSYFSESTGVPELSDWQDSYTSKYSNMGKQLRYYTNYNACIKAFTASEEINPELDDYGTDEVIAPYADPDPYPRPNGGGGCEVSAGLGMLFTLVVLIEKKQK